MFFEKLVNHASSLLQLPPEVKTGHRTYELLDLPSGMITWYNAVMDEKLSEHDSELILEALTIRERDGISLRAALEEVPMSSDTYYRRKEQFPREVEDLQREAEKTARNERRERREEFDRQQYRMSMQIQEQARNALVAAMPTIVKIARGEPLTVVNETTGEKKVRPTCPRDAIAATKLLQTLTRDGILTGDEVLPQKEEEAQQVRLPATLDFSKMMVERPDGTQVHISEFTRKDTEEQVDSAAETS